MLARLARAQQFNDACNRSYNAGKAEFPDFDEAVRNLGMVGALGENGNPAFLEIVAEMPEGHKVLHHLGKNLLERPAGAETVTATDDGSDAASDGCEPGPDSEYERLLSYGDPGRQE